MYFIQGVILILIGIFGLTLSAILPIMPFVVLIMVCGGVLKGILKIFK